MATGKKSGSHTFKKENPVGTLATFTSGYLVKGQRIDKYYCVQLGLMYQINTSNKRHSSLSSGNRETSNHVTVQTQGLVDTSSSFTDTCVGYSHG